MSQIFLDNVCEEMMEWNVRRCEEILVVSDNICMMECEEMLYIIERDCAINLCNK